MKSADNSDAGSPELTVVVVTYNEESRIRSCLDSVFAACEDLCDFEVILVDSNSTDRTVEFATAYPITVLRIGSDDLTTPGAGRYVGTRAATGELLLFVDGDMRLSTSWLAKAVDLLDGDDVAAVDGHLNSPADDEEIREVDSVRGVALYDAEPLRSVGGFDPWLRSLEDVHLGHLLTGAGYRLLRLPAVAATHPDSETVFEPLRRWRRGYTIGPGQVLRRSIRSPRLLRMYLSRFRYRFALLAWVLAGIGTAIAWPLSVVGWIVASLCLGAVLVLRLGPVGAAAFMIQKFLDLLGLLPGLLERPRPRESYPIESIEVVKRGPRDRSSSTVR